MDSLSTSSSQSSQLKCTDFLGGPIPCVGLVLERNLLLYGQGPFMCVQPFHNNNNNTGNDIKTTKLQVFEKENVHGFQLWQPQQDNHDIGLQLAIVWGGACIVVLQVKKDHTLVPLLQSTLSDWIWDCQIQTATSTLLVGLAHNRLQVLYLKIPQTKQMQGAACIQATLGKIIACAKPCMSYCMALHDKKIAIGSITQGILLWNIPSELNQDHTQPVQAQLKDHQGVIHGLRFNQDGTYLASASDDRTVRLWKQNTNEQWDLEWTAWGHLARCWKVAFCCDDDNHNDSPVVVSTAEDGTARLWQNGSSLVVLRGHCSPNIWSVASQGPWIVTGGGNGALAIHNWRRRLQTNRNNICKIYECTIPDDRMKNNARTNDEPTKQQPRKKAKRKFTQQITMGLHFCRLYEEDTMLVATRNGSLMGYNLESSGSWTAYHDWYEDDEYEWEAADGVSMAVHPCHPVAAIGVKPGHILLVKILRSEHHEESNAKRVIGILPAHGLKAPSRLQWLTPKVLAAFYAQSLRIWFLPHATNAVETSIGRRPNDMIRGARSNTFSSGLRAVVTCVALQDDDCFENKNSLIAVGSNRGNVCIYQISLNHPGNEDSLTIPPLSLRRLHGREHVNDICWTSESSLVSVGNDGMICHSTVSSTGLLSTGLSVPLLSLSGLVRLLKVPTLYNDDSASGFCVAGYLGNQLSVVDAATGYEFVSIDTGGRGRSLALHLGNANYNCSCVWIAIAANRKDGLNNLHLEMHDLVPRIDVAHVKVTRGITLHHETIFDICSFVLPFGRIAIISGSEDCASRVSIWSDGCFVVSQQLTPQESGIRAVCCSGYASGSDTLIVVGGSKMRLQFFVAHQDSPDLGEDERNPRQRLAIHLVGQDKGGNQVSIDHRINAIDTVRITALDEDSQHMVATGDSNGRIYIYLVDEKTDSISSGMLLHDSERPVLSLRFFQALEKIFLVFGTSGGDIRVVEASSFLGKYEGSVDPAPVIIQYSGHSIGANCLSAICTHSGGEEAVTIASGGDDQALTLCRLSLKEGRLSLDTTKKFSEASISAIRSVHWMSQDQIVTAGYGAQLGVWRVAHHALTLELEQSVAVQVGDINGMTTSKLGNGRYLLGVAGCGVQVFEQDSSALRKI